MDRYRTPLQGVFSRQHKLELEWRVELALLQALGEAGLAPSGAHKHVSDVIACASARRAVAWTLRAASPC